MTNLDAANQILDDAYALIKIEKNKIDRSGNYADRCNYNDLNSAMSRITECKGKIDNYEMRTASMNNQQQSKS